MSLKPVTFCQVYNEYGTEGLTEEGKSTRKIMIGCIAGGIGGVVSGALVIVLAILFPSHPFLNMWQMPPVTFTAIVATSGSIMALCGSILAILYTYLGYCHPMSEENMNHEVHPDIIPQLRA